MKQKNKKIVLKKRFFVFVGIFFILIILIIKGCVSSNNQPTKTDETLSKVDQTILNEDALSAIITDEYILKYVVNRLESSGMNQIVDVSMDLGRVNTYIIVDDKENIFYIALSDGGSITLYDSQNNIIG